ncbi:radical SAM protein [Caldicellulosiruptor danielii]|uniref:Radical SAM protein n=1 Tax=Anaerocellum danielii TaxID=1387557 RepID=A0ABZ0TXG6_9FIRM|nr:radical SAM protein [Caldicellulosiruptor danielii]WPX07801.1 radical SAM protein [Caldicellulosiruptor danielii]
MKTPFSLYVFPTTFCNFKCIYCAHSLGLSKMKEKYNFEAQNMSMETFMLVIEQARRFPEKLKLLSLTGQGEPLLNSNIAKMVEYAKKYNIAERVEIITNASLLDYEMAKQLIEAGLDVIRISIQGLSSDKYKEICRSDIKFEDIIDKISYFYKNKNNCKVFVKVIDVALQEGEDEKFYSIFSDISDRMFIEKCKPVYNGVEYPEDVYRKIDRYGREHQGRKVCPLPFYMLAIYPNGDVVPCDSIYKPINLGNVHSDSLISMWNSDKLKEFWLLQLRKLRFKNDKCRVCYAPDDVAHPEDDLDQDCEELIKKLE